jgi:DNA-binding HxlR family transcriptional regulator
MNYPGAFCATIAGMALPKDYAGEGCSLARALEVVGERWTLLIVRDAFFGVRRFGDFAAHLAIPRAVLTHRLAALAEAGVLTVIPGSHGHDEYVLTAKGLDLWPVIRSLLVWGDDYYSAQGPRRLFRHAIDEGDVAQDGTCAACGGVIPAPDLVVTPGPGWAPNPAKTDPVSAALAAPHRLLTSIRNLPAYRHGSEITAYQVAGGHGGER